MVSKPSGITEAQTDKLAMGANGVVESVQVLGARTPSKDLQGKVTLP